MITSDTKSNRQDHNTYIQWYNGIFIIHLSNSYKLYVNLNKLWGRKGCGVKHLIAWTFLGWPKWSQTRCTTSGFVKTGSSLSSKVMSGSSLFTNVTDTSRIFIRRYSSKSSEFSFLNKKNRYLKHTFIQQKCLKKILYSNKSKKSDS